MGVELVYLTIIEKRFKSVKEQGEKAIKQLSEEEIHWYPNKECNSASVIVKHLNRNMKSRWIDFLTSDGEKENRNRDQEFINTISSKDELMKLWEEGWGVLFNALGELTSEDLNKEVTIRGESLSVIDAIERQLVHYASHIGQIVYLSKQLKAEKWTTLSIPKGKSEEYFRKMKERHDL
ncbi:DUF1572 family protein [Halobacillus sp. Marseille-P3879]|uniref:DUF1572 family protein n=1 Tax=Halobacillus sp. Marseille-P3879 TaxID=2045014 RepID=UPI000C7E6B7C|nr:DUF1572 family protein [Halobacillus sp. Marseille-P3879]